MFELKQEVGSQIVYRGTITVENQHLICKCNSDAFPETTFIRLSHPIGNECDKMYGVWMSYDHDKRPASGAIFFARKEITRDEAEEVIEKCYAKVKSKPIVVFLNEN